MILHKHTTEAEKFLKVNNDIYRIMTVFNKDEALKKMLVNTGKNPLQDGKVDKDLRDKQIARCPLLPYDDEDGSLIIITMIDSDMDFKGDSLYPTLAIDVYTPGNQWIINEGVRPLHLVHIIDNLMQFELTQTDGVRYRLTKIVTAQLSDILLGYRMLYVATVND